MNERREFLQLAAILSLATPAALQAQTADAPPARGRGEIARIPLSGDLAGKEAVLVDLIAPAGRASGARAHRHPGFVLGYVIDGEYILALNDAQPVTVRAGETFFEAAGDKHGGNTPVVQEKPAHLLAFMVVPADAQLSSPA